VRWLATVEGVTSTASASVGQLLREWRARRRLRQLDLSIQADISARHLSFVETGRSRPTRRMILRLSEHLDVPLRERNQLLLAGGYAPAYPQHGLDEPQIGAVRDALKQVLRSHEPFPAVVINRWWDMVDGNRAIGLFVADCAPELLEPPVNVLRLTLHPDGGTANDVTVDEVTIEAFYPADAETKRALTAGETAATASAQIGGD
jgi:transcriptional regulator with XRE-family HTH domain